MGKKKVTHFLEWRRFRMACGKRPDQIWNSASYWSMVTCPKCLRREPLGETRD